MARLSAPLLGSILGTHLDTILQARVVIGAIVGAGGAPECLKAGGSCAWSSAGTESVQPQKNGEVFMQCTSSIPKET